MKDFRDWIEYRRGFREGFEEGKQWNPDIVVPDEPADWEREDEIKEEDIEVPYTIEEHPEEDCPKGFPFGKFLCARYDPEEELTIGFQDFCEGCKLPEISDLYDKGLSESEDMSFKGKSNRFASLARKVLEVVKSIRIDGPYKEYDPPLPSPPGYEEMREVEGAYDKYIEACQKWEEKRIEMEEKHPNRKGQFFNKYIIVYAKVKTLDERVFTSVGVTKVGHDQYFGNREVQTAATRAINRAHDRIVKNLQEIKKSIKEGGYRKPTEGVNLDA